jgi:hypothetical protein
MADPTSMMAGGLSQRGIIGQQQQQGSGLKDRSGLQTSEVVYLEIVYARYISQ